MHIFKRFHGSTNSRRRQSPWGFDTKLAKNFIKRSINVGHCKSDFGPETEVTDTSKFVKKHNNVKRQQEYKKVIIFQIKDGN